MITFIAVENATGDMYELTARTADLAYRAIAKEVLKMPDYAEADFDTGNVDFDLYEISTVKELKPKKLEMYEGK